MVYFVTSMEHILAELERIDLLIQAQVWRARQLNEANSEFQGLYIREEEVDALLARPTGLPHWATEPLPQARREIQSALDQLVAKITGCKVSSRKQGITLRLDCLQTLFQLSSFEVDALLVCLAPEIDLRYERLFGYLQDDITKRRPSVDLVLNLLSPTFEAKLDGRRYFAPHAPLFKQGLLHLFDDPSQPHPTLLSKYLKVEARVVNYLFEDDEIADKLAPYARIHLPQIRIEKLMLPTDVKRRLVQLTRECHTKSSRLIFYFQGGYGTGKETTAAALCCEVGMRLLTVDGQKLLNAEDLAFEKAVRLVRREALLQNAVLYWTGFDALLGDDRRPWCRILLQELEERIGLTIVAGDIVWEPTGALYKQPFIRVEFPHLTYKERRQFWPMSLNGGVAMDTDVDLSTLAAKFRFTPGQIQDTAATARNLALWRDPDRGHVTMADLNMASRLQSNRRLGELAHKITPHYMWDDIVLSVDRMEQLREIVNQVKFRAKVYEEWGFDRKLAMGKGLNALFAGPSGTGKTMAADIMAGELGLDLYKIDLSAVVSKYIGETEKNLSRIFQEAETSNAILFFDEADALFGKRSEVRDAQDRYANIEISYLLQRMEEYDGMVILATNLRNNLDDAFVRRMHFTVAFPLPDEDKRLRIWENIWPPETPTSNLDLAFMAERFKLSGGNIKNIALAAAFLAAEGEQEVRMEYVIRATQREYQKMGKTMVDKVFTDYSESVEHGS